MSKAAFLPSLLTLFAVAFFVVLFVFFPVTYMRLVVEDSFVEFATFLTYIAAALYFLIRFLNHSDSRPYGLLLFALGCFVLGMEEISWGQRMLSFEPADYFSEHNRQGEANLHNLFNHRAFMAAFSLAVLSWVILYPLLLRLNITWLNRLQADLSLPLVPAIWWPCFLIVLFMLVVDFPSRGEEVYEWFLSVLFLLVAFGSKTTATTKLLTLLAIMVLALMLAIFFFQPDTYERGLQRLALKHYSRMDMCRQALLVRDELEARGVVDFEARVIRTSLERRSGLSDDRARNLSLPGRKAVAGALKQAQLLAAKGDLAAARLALGYPFGPDITEGMTEHGLLAATTLHMALKDYEFAGFLVDEVDRSTISRETDKALNVLGRKIVKRSQQDTALPPGLLANCSE